MHAKCIHRTHCALKICTYVATFDAILVTSDEALNNKNIEFFVNWESMHGPCRLLTFFFFKLIFSNYFIRDMPSVSSSLNPYQVRHFIQTICKVNKQTPQSNIGLYTPIS